MKVPLLGGCGFTLVRESKPAGGDEVLAVYQKLVDHPRVGRGDKFEASVGIGIVYHELEELRKRKTLVDALKLSRMYARTVVLIIVD